MLFCFGVVENRTTNRFFNWHFRIVLALYHTQGAYLWETGVKRSHFFVFFVSCVLEWSWFVAKLLFFSVVIKSLVLYYTMLVCVHQNVERWQHQHRKVKAKTRWLWRSIIQDIFTFICLNRSFVFYNTSLSCFYYDLYTVSIPIHLKSMCMCGETMALDKLSFLTESIDLEILLVSSGASCSPKIISIL